MPLITFLPQTFKEWLANLEHVMIEFADVLNKMIHDEKITLECLKCRKGTNRSLKSLQII